MSKRRTVKQGNFVPDDIPPVPLGMPTSNPHFLYEDLPDPDNPGKMKTWDYDIRQSVFLVCFFIIASFGLLVLCWLENAVDISVRTLKLRIDKKDRV